MITRCSNDMSKFQRADVLIDTASALLRAAGRFDPPFGGLRRHSGERPCTLLQGIANPLPSSRDTLEKAGGVWAGGGVTTANVLVCMTCHMQAEGVFV